MSLIKLKNVSKFYYNKSNISTGFSRISLDIDMGEFVVITGESGSGKSTLLNVISGLDSYEEGEMYINGEETSHYTEVDYENYRRKYIGNIFQNFNLVNSYSVYQNIELVLLLNGYKKRECKEKVMEIIKTVGLSKYKNTKASKLSGGQKQRVAIARALAKDTPIIVADEPTGNLDVKSASSIMKLLKEISKDKLVVIVTHNYEQVEGYATRRISMNDGHIIEDKKLTSFEPVEPQLVKYKDLTFGNKLRLGARNAFNIKTKFVLLFLVYFFLTLLVFSEYSGLSKMVYEEELFGYNTYFIERSPERIIIKKQDKSLFTDDEIASIGKIDNVKYVERNDAALDHVENIYNNDIYLSGKFKSINGINSVDVGRMPEGDDEVVIVQSEDSFYYSIYGERLFDGTYTLNNDSKKVKVVGIVLSDNTDFFDGNNVIYVRDSLLDYIKLTSAKNNARLSLKVGNRTFGEDDYDYYFTVKSNPNVQEGQVFVPNSLNMYCSYYDCHNKTIGLSVKDMYFEDNKDFTVKKILDKDNFKKETGLNDYDLESSTIFINETDYMDLFVKGDYQVSVFVEDVKLGDETKDALEKLGYDVFYMKDALANPSAQMMGILKIFRNVVFIVATVALFFICYFIIKIILKARNVYFSTIRILGATKKVSRQLLNIELFIDINVAFLAFILLVIFATSEVINYEYINDLVTYFTLKDYVTIYIVLVTMSLLISNRYAKKLFKDSAMSTYREEV